MKHIFFVTGVPGAGKSYIANLISKELEFPYIDYDSVNCYFIDWINKNMNIKSIEESMKIVRDATYLTLNKLILDILIGSNVVVVSAPFTKEKYYNSSYVDDLKDKIPEKSRIIEINIQVSKETLFKNLRKRKSPRDLEKVRDWNNYWQSLKVGPGIWSVDYVKEYHNESANDTSALLNDIRSLCDTLNPSIESITC